MTPQQEIDYGHRKHYLNQCAACGVSFNPHRRQQAYCSRKCAVGCRTGNKRRNQVAVECSDCGSALLRKSYNASKFKRHFCSRQCKANYDAIRYLGRCNPNFRNAGHKTCMGCSRPFVSYNALRKFCSIRCAHKYANGHPIYASQVGLMYELECMKVLEVMGYAAWRTRASRGPFDVVGCNGSGFLFIQVKKTTGSNPPSSTWKALRLLTLPQNSKKQVWIHTRHNVWKVIELN